MLRFAIAALAALGSLFGSVRAADAGSVTSCTTTISDKIIDSDLVVPDGKTCDLENVTVTGNVYVEKHATFFTQFLSSGSTVILGNVVATHCHFISAASLFVGGNVQIEACNGASASGIASATISGNFACEFSPSGCGTSDSTISGNMQINKNGSFVTVRDNYVGGNLQCVGNPPSSLTVSGNTVAGNKQGQCADQ